MDDLFLEVKRGHLVLNRWALLKLREFGVTPARFALMRALYERNFKWAQSELRMELGVARATISRMVRALVRLGWIERKVNAFDRRTLDCILTYEGRKIVASVMSALVWPKLIAKIVDAALTFGGDGADVEKERWAVGWLVRRIVFAFAIPRTLAESG